MADSPGRVYFDSCLFIELLQQSDQARFEACELLRVQAEKNELIIVTSAITITEVNQLPDAKAMLPEDQSKKILSFFLSPYVAVRPVTRRIAEMAHELTRTHGLTNIDAIHIATACAKDGRVSVFYTYDNPKKKRKGLLRHNLKIGDPPLRIELPPPPSFGPLFDKKDGDQDDD